MPARKLVPKATFRADVVPKEKTAEFVRGWLKKSGEFSGDESDRIVNAVLWHSGFNLPDGDDVLIALQDADRVCCSMLEESMNAAQFFPKLPTVDPVWLAHDPTAHSYRNPKSVLKNLECLYDWVDRNSKVCIRLPKAWKLMEEFVGDIRKYIETIERQRRVLGLYPDYPVKF